MRDLGSVKPHSNFASQTAFVCLRTGTSSVFRASRICSPRLSQPEGRDFTYAVRSGAWKRPCPIATSCVYPRSLGRLPQLVLLLPDPLVRACLARLAVTVVTSTPTRPRLLVPSPRRRSRTRWIKSAKSERRHQRIRARVVKAEGKSAASHEGAKSSMRPSRPCGNSTGRRSGHRTQPSRASERGTPMASPSESSRAHREAWA